MENYSLKTIDDSVQILFDVLGKPEWFTWNDEKINFNFDPRYRVEMSLKGMGGSAGFSKLPDGSSLLHGGMPLYIMEQKTLENFDFLTMLCLDLIKHFLPVYEEAASHGDEEWTKKVTKLVGNIGLFLDMLLTERPGMVSEMYTRLIQENLHDLGFPKYKKLPKRSKR